MTDKERFFVNLKRFDIPKEMGGICPSINSTQWLNDQLSFVSLEMNRDKKIPEVVFLLPESLLATAVSNFPNLSFGSQSVIDNDVEHKKNFGAFTGMRTAKSVKALGCDWTMIGHSEERAYIKNLLGEFAELAEIEREDIIEQTLGNRLNRQIKRAIKADLNVLFCIGETLSQRGEGKANDSIFDNVNNVLSSQLEIALSGIDVDKLRTNLVVAYEPIWAIGPGKTPPDSFYIQRVSEMIHGWFNKTLSIDVNILYGGGFKKDNSFSISSIDSIQGGLVALTRFTDDIGFYANEFIEIMKLSKWYVG